MKPAPIGRFVDTPSYEELQEEIARLRLTVAERRAMEFAIAAYPLDDSIPATLRGLLERTK
jgi:hypothetical protein